MDYREPLSGSFYQGRFKSCSPIILGIVLAAHTVFIILLLNEKIRSHATGSEQILKMINLVPEREVIAVAPTMPDFNSARAIQITVPPIQFSEPTLSPTILPSNEPSNESAGASGGVFDPKMRQKLLDAKEFNRPNAQGKTRGGAAIDGRTYIEKGNGACMVTMSQVDAQDRGTNWGVTSCGGNDSEKAMERVMADVESRRGSGKPQGQ